MADRGTSTSDRVTTVTVNSTQPVSRAVYVGVDNDYDFYINGSWVAFKGAKAGTVLPIQAGGARKNADSSAPSSGDIVFLY